MQRLLLLLSLFLFGCSTVVSGTAVFIVGKYSEAQEKKTRRYKTINDCFIKGKPSAFHLAESVAHGSAISSDYRFILNPEKQDKDPDLPHHLAYAFYVVAENIGDVRANQKKEWLKKYMEKGEGDDIERFIKRKYFPSYLYKCFSVPKSYKKRVSIIDKIRGN